MQSVILAPLPVVAQLDRMAGPPRSINDQLPDSTSHFLTSFGMLILLVLFLCCVVAARRSDRARIVEQIALRGWTVTGITRWPVRFGLNVNRGGRGYRVSYRTKDGTEVTAECVTSWMIGVYWITNRPPSSP